MDDIHLDEGEVFVLASLQVMMLDRDLSAEKQPSPVKEKTCAEAVAASVAMLESLSQDAPLWVRSYAQSCAPISAEAVLEAPARLSEHVTSRAHAVLLMTELMIFHPWPDAKVRWSKKVRQQSLRDAASMLTALRDNDLTLMQREFELLTRRLRRASVKWGRVALVSVAGLGVGALTAGWAAPFIGAAVGSAMGLSGAAATSAGLAALGGGSLAAGGFGMAGGTALLTGLGGAAGAGAAAAGARWSPWAAGKVITDAIKLDLLTRVVFADDDEKARYVVASLQQRIVDLAKLTNQLGEQIRELSKDKARLTAENRELRQQLRRQQADARRAEVALEIVVDRLTVHHSSDDASDTPRGPAHADVA
jgi:hypothetical protein